MFITLHLNGWAYFVFYCAEMELRASSYMQVKCSNAELHLGMWGEVMKQYFTETGKAWDYYAGKKEIGGCENKSVNAGESVR